MHHIKEKSSEVRKMFLNELMQRHRLLIRRVAPSTERNKKAPLTEDQSLSFTHLICNEIRRIEKLDIGGRSGLFIDLSHILGNLYNYDALGAQVWWVLKRYKLFKTLPLPEQRRYLKNLIEWRNIGDKTDGLYLAYFLPGIHIFHLLTSMGEAPECPGENWFVWWYTSRRHGFLRVDCNKEQRILDEDRMLLERTKIRLGRSV